MCSDALDTVLACDLPMMGTHIVWIDCADKFEICKRKLARLMRCKVYRYM